MVSALAQLGIRLLVGITLFKLPNLKGNHHRFISQIDVNKRSLKEVAASWGCLKRLSQGYDYSAQYFQALRLGIVLIIRSQCQWSKKITRRKTHLSACINIISTSSNIHSFLLIMLPVSYFVGCKIWNTFSDSFICLFKALETCINIWCK